MTSVALLPRVDEGRRTPGWWGMACLCLTEAGLFVYLLGAYVYLRGNAVSFASEGGKHPDLLFPLILTVLLTSSSVVLRWGEIGIKRGDVSRLVIALALTIALGLGFLITQYVEYAHEVHAPQTDAYWSAFYAITGIHGAHVVLGVLMLSMNLVRALSGHFTAERHLAVKNGAMYWHTVDGVWLAILCVLYLSPYFS